MNELLRQKIADILVENDMNYGEAYERTNNILQIVYLDYADWQDIASMLVPSKIHAFIGDIDTREKVAKEILRVYIAETMDTLYSRWMSLQMFCGDSAENASAWLKSNNYTN